MQHLFTPEGDTPKEGQNCPCTIKVDEAQFLKLQADIEALRQRVESAEEETYQINQESQTFKDIKEAEAKTHKILMETLDKFQQDPKAFTKENVLLCDSLVNTLDRYRHVKVQHEAIKHVKLNVYSR